MNQRGQLQGEGQEQARLMGLGVKESCSKEEMTQGLAGCEERWVQGTWLEIEGVKGR